MDNEQQQHTPETNAKSSGSSWKLPAAGGFAAGIVLTGTAILLLMPGMMIVTEPSQLGFDETVSTIQESLEEQGWSSPGTININKSLAAKGEDIPFRVRIVQLCHPEYAADVLTTDRYVSSLMPCAVAVWEDEDGKVFISKMNTGLMGKLFGGNIAKVMGGKVAQDEAAILDPVLK